jgi:hypothetical protein
MEAAMDCVMALRSIDKERLLSLKGLLTRAQIQLLTGYFVDRRTMKELAGPRGITEGAVAARLNVISDILVKAGLPAPYRVEMHSPDGHGHDAIRMSGQALDTMVLNPVTGRCAVSRTQRTPEI